MTRPYHVWMAMNRCFRTSRTWRAMILPPVTAILVVSAPVAAGAQTATVRVDRENFRAAPSGVVLAEVVAGTPLALGETRDRWRAATLEGWIWDASITAEAVDGHDLVVSSADGENLRAEPNGAILARLEEGMRLQEVERRDRWVRVRRQGWIWEPSLRLAGAEAGARNTDQAGARAAADAPAGGTAGSQRQFVRVGDDAQVLSGPGGDPVARLEPGTTVEVLGAEGDWTRVRVEGWTFTGNVTLEGEATILQDVSAADLAAEPARFRGRVVQWSLQFIALEQAERFRTDFLEGEHFILARGPGEEAGFVYLAVPPERMGAARSLAPLQRFGALARVRIPHSPLTDAPVLDLLEILEPAR